MKLVEQHIIEKGDPRFKQIDEAAFASKNLYNAEKSAAVDPALLAALDVGVNVLAALTSNKAGFIPCLLNGRPLKSINHLDRLTTKRNRRVQHYLHTASRRIIDLLVAEGIGSLIIGKNPFWKQEMKISVSSCQGFVILCEF